MKKKTKKEKKIRKQYKPEEPSESESPQQVEERLNALRKRHKIHVEGISGNPGLLEEFDHLHRLGAPQWLQSAVHFCNFPGVQPIQMQAIPVLMQGYHITASAPTGSGKTMAFLIPILAKLGKPGKGLARALIVDPTRELAQQTMREFDRLTQHKKFKGKLLDKPMNAENKAQKLDLAIATPARLCQLLQDGLMSLDDTKHLVLDEADKLLDLGFAPQIDEILSYCQVDALQIILFSATMPPAVVELANSILSNPVRISVGNANAGSSDVDQELIFVGPEASKLMSFRQLAKEGKIVPPTLVFVQSKDRAQALFNELVYDGLNVDVIHADRTRAQRDNSIAAFRAGKIWVLICTDVMARGVDFKGVDLVLNYDMPQAAATYIHRIGRTGRAGRKGRALTFFSLDDFDHLKTIVNVMVASGCKVPEFLTKMKAPSRKMKKNAEYHKKQRSRISTHHNDAWSKKTAKSTIKKIAKLKATANGPDATEKKKRKKKATKKQV